MTQEPRLDVILCEWLLEQRVVVEIDLADREVVGRPPVRIHQCPFFVGQSGCGLCPIACRTPGRRRNRHRSRPLVIAPVVAMRRLISAAVSSSISSVYFLRLAALLQLARR